MKKDQMVARITSDNDQDRAMCDQWMRETPPEERIKVWMFIQQDFKNPYMEIMSRFAQLAFGEATERMNQKDSAP